MALTHASSTSKPANQSTHLETNTQYWILWCYMSTCPFVLQRNSFGKVRQQHDGTETCVWWIHYSNMNTRTGWRDKRKVGLYVRGRGCSWCVSLSQFLVQAPDCSLKAALSLLEDLLGNNSCSSQLLERKIHVWYVYSDMWETQSNADQWEPLSSRWTRISVIINQK